jgi:hypothetical protein
MAGKGWRDLCPGNVAEIKLRKKRKKRKKLLLVTIARFVTGLV